MVIFSGSFGFVSIILISVVIWQLCNLINDVRFHLLLIKLKHQNKGKTPYKMTSFFGNIRKNIGQSWLIKNKKINVIVVGIFIFFASGYRSYATQSALEMSRGGAIIVLLGLWAILLGFLEEQNIEKEYELITKSQENDNKDLLNNLKQKIHKAQFGAAKVSFTVSLIGTLVWAFGDQLIGCGLFPVWNIPDLSSVVCIK